MEAFSQLTWLFCLICVSFPSNYEWLDYGNAAVNILLLKTNEHAEPDIITLDKNCFWHLDLKTEELYWSDELCLLLGFQKTNTPTFDQLMQSFEAEQNIQAAFNRAIHQGIPFQLQIPSLLANDKVILVCTTAAPFYDDYGQCIAIKGTLQNETQFNVLAATFPNASEKTVSQQVMLNNFAKVVSHDLRSQTVNLQMEIEFAEQKNICEEMQEFVSNIKTISNNLNQTVGYLNTLTKI